MIYLASLKVHINFENPSRNPLQRPYKAAMLTYWGWKPTVILQNHIGSRLSQVNSCVFFAAS